MSWRGFFYVARREWVYAVMLVVILSLGVALRWYGLGWDAGYLFHPDERQILLVATNLQLPKNGLEFFSSSSPLNPHFFAYGSFPIYLLRALAPFAPPSNLVGPWQDDFLARWIVFGRAISGAFDLGTMVLVYLLGRRLYTPWVGLCAAACVALTVLHIQLSHFYAVDTLLTFFVLTTLYAAVRFGEQPTRGWLVMCGGAFGLALATKISAVPLIFPIAYAVHHASISAYNGSYTRFAHPHDSASEELPNARLKVRTGLVRQTVEHTLHVWRQIRRSLLQICGVAFAVFVLTQPYIVIDGFTFGRDVIREGAIARGWMDVPYTIQFAHTLPYLYQIQQSAVWGMGLPLGLFGWGGAAWFIYRYWRGRQPANSSGASQIEGCSDRWRGGILLSWGLIYFILIGGQYVKYPRYLLPLLPVLYLMASRVVLSCRARRFRVTASIGVVLGTSLLYALAFVSIYGREHPWLIASRWIYENAKPGSVLAIEAWDDSLPVLINSGPAARRGSEYRSIVLPIYDQDGPAKLGDIASALAHADFVIVASRRAYGSIGQSAERFPLTSGYYQKLFAGELGFELAETVRNDPQIGAWQIADDPRFGLALNLPETHAQPAGQTWNWGFADESLTVYDHPQPLIFRKARALSQAELYALLSK